MCSISFIMPAYKAGFIKEAIDSILNQTNNDWELVVVDDCSPENLVEIVNKYDDPRIIYHRNAANIGRDNLVDQWNHSISYAKGEWIVLAADDDLYAPEFVEECLNLAKKYPQVDLIRARVEQIDEDGCHLWDDGVFGEYSNKYQFLHDWIVAKAFTCVGNYAFRRSALESIGGFMDFPCAFGSDIATPIELSKNGVANTSDMLFFFRQSSNHLSADKSRYKEKLAGITKLSKYLQAINYEDPQTDEDKQFFSVASKEYLQSKCVYDYFNLVIKFIPLAELAEYLKLCVLASPKDKFMMLLRWIKRRV